MSGVARKRFGQNFLHDQGIIRRIVTAVGPDANDHIVEIGPGHGAITQHLAAEAARLDVIEIDRDLAAELEQQDWFRDENAYLHVNDALEFDFRTLVENPQQKLRLVGNLPYNISTPLLFHLLDSADIFQDLHVMLQKEVVQRMAAEPGNKSYGRLSVSLQARCEVEPLFNIGSGAFTPAPKVESSFARLIPLATPRVGPELQSHFDAVVRQAFGQRRKQLGNTLKGLLSTEQIAAAGVEPSARPETLSVDAFVALARQCAE